MDPIQPQQKQSVNPALFFKNIWSGNNAKSKRLILFVSAVLLLAAAAGLYSYNSIQNENAKRRAAEQAAPENSNVQLSPEQKKQLTGEAILKGGDGYNARMTLAEAYMAEGNPRKAIFNYEKAREFADPKDPMYESQIAAVDAAIKAIQGRQ